MKKIKNAPMRAKAVSIIIILCMLFSLTACGGNNQHGAGVSTRDDEEIDEITHGVDEPHQDIDAGVDIADPTADPTPTISEPAGNGKYSYSLYGKNITMDINVEDYIKNYGDEVYFNLGLLAKDLGWVKDDYREDLYTLQNGDLVVVMSIGCYESETIPGTSYNQIRSISYGLDTTDWKNYYSDNDVMSHRSFSLSFDRHFSQCNYALINPSSYSLSYDDIVLLSYVLWAGSTNPRENPMVVGFGENFEYISQKEGIVLYNLP